MQRLNFLSLLESLFVITILSSLATKHQSAAFVGTNRCWRVSSFKATPDDDDDKGTFEYDDEFYRDLRRAKLNVLGRSIPPEQARESAVQAEDDFLQAMRETKNEFQKAKEELGSDGAVDLFLERIREEDERNDDDES